jgi:hypothetical protein
LGYPRRGRDESAGVGAAHDEARAERDIQMGRRA